ncbi:MAG: PHP domain-containing protein, partial [Synechococcus sp.]
MPVDQHPLRSVLDSVDPASCPTRLNFHCHSLCSDGSLSPAQIAEQAVEIGLEHMAVTDHHSAEAWDPMQQRLSELSRAGHAVPT